MAENEDSSEEPKTYLADIISELKRQWPENRPVNLVFHGHSVPAGYTSTPVVDTLDAYPNLLLKELKERFPFAIINAIVTARGGEDSVSGEKRFAQDVLCHRPDMVTIDYGLNDRRIGLQKSRQAWSTMIDQAMEMRAKVILLSPTLDLPPTASRAETYLSSLEEHAELIRDLAKEYRVGLADSSMAFYEFLYYRCNSLSSLLSTPNHPNRHGHQLVVRELMRWFPTSSN